jgi:transcriptional regulator of acetoin/glycerol metabolism
MARHNRARWPRDPEQRELAKRRHSQILTQLRHQAEAVRRHEAATAAARAELTSWAVELAKNHDLDVTDIAREIGVSRDTMYRLIRSHSESSGAPAVSRLKPGA